MVIINYIKLFEISSSKPLGLLKMARSKSSKNYCKIPILYVFSSGLLKINKERYDNINPVNYHREFLR